VASPGNAGGADPLYAALSRQRAEVLPVQFGGAGYLRMAAAPYNTPDDYDRLAAIAAGLLGSGQGAPPYPGAGASRRGTCATS
jgi:hypothetical protein